MRIGIITPTHNRPHLLKQAISSVLNNRYQEWVMCIVDDGSENPDSYKEALSPYQNDPRILYHRLDVNQGVNIARNFALEKLLELQCDFITLLDDDDVFTEDALERAVDEKKCYPDKEWLVSYCKNTKGELITQLDLPIRELDYIDYLASAGMSGDATHMISAKIIGDIRFSTKVRQGQEWTFFIQIPAKMHIYPFHSKTIQYLQNGLSKTAEQRDFQDRQKVKALEKEFGISKKSLRKRYFRYRACKALQYHRYLEMVKYLLRLPIGI